MGGSGGSGGLGGRCAAKLRIASASAATVEYGSPSAFGGMGKGGIAKGGPSGNGAPSSVGAIAVGVASGGNAIEPAGAKWVGSSKAAGPLQPGVGGWLPNALSEARVGRLATGTWAPGIGGRGATGA